MGNKTNKSTIVVKQKVIIEEEKERKKQGCCGSCFGSKKQREVTKTITKQVIRQPYKNSYIHDTRKSSILVKSMANVQLQDQLFEGRDKQLLDIRMKRAEPYEILKDSDYFDSELDQREELGRLKKVYENCEIANYQTPQTQKLQTVMVKTYLFDRNLTKIQA